MWLMSEMRRGKIFNSPRKVEEDACLQNIFKFKCTRSEGQTSKDLYLRSVRVG